ncbi:MAG: molybdenum cofactor guanylyltransferase [Acidobacteria bacterium]|nr:molybdenum cofactor guanylyltransferase [Acidobacteriota bacterium]
MTISEIEGFILTGGASSRMGTDKAHLRLGDQTFVEKIRDALAELMGQVSVVSSKPDAAACGLPVVPDVYPGRGAMSGLHSALAHARAPWAAVVSCDLPFVTGELFRQLASRLLRQVRTHWVGFDELSRLDGADCFFVNVNTPEEYEQACLSAAVSKA